MIPGDCVISAEMYYNGAVADRHASHIDAGRRLEMSEVQSGSGEIDTSDVEEIILDCEDTDDLVNKVFPCILEQKEQWSVKMSEILDEIKALNISVTKFASLCGVKRQTVYNWKKGILPQNREEFILIGLTAGYSVEKMNRLLQRYGRYPALYSKSLEDCVCLFVLKQGYGVEAVEKYHYILDRIKARIIRDDHAETAPDISTDVFDEKLSEVRSEDELEAFIIDNALIFSNAFHKLYAYIMMNITANYLEPYYAGNIYEMSVIQEWSSSLIQCVSNIRQNKWYPTRNKIISLGVHLSMDHEQINEMLDLAHMEPLCAKNIFESTIIFILEDASLNDMLNSDSTEYDPEALCYYTRTVLSKMGLPNIDAFITELPGEYDEL